ncbi:MAG TPA: hypothetical protein VGJ95_06940 [Pseudonocardiaceae bacterium]|jgi:nitroreductase
MNALSARAESIGERWGLTPGTIDWSTAIAATDAAPSINGARPWRFLVRPDAVELHADWRRAPGSADPTGRDARIAGGAALFTMQTALRAAGIEPRITLLPNAAHPTLLATVQPGGHRPPSAQETALYRAVTHRHPYPTRPDAVSEAALLDIEDAAAAEGGFLRVVTDPPTAAAIAELVRRLEHRQGRGRPSRWSPPLIGVLLSAGDTPRHHLRVGQALQRALLTATDHGVAVSVVGAPADLPLASAWLQVMIDTVLWPQLVLRFGSVAG